ncbi:MAG: cation diffusion facilitator family transporter [Actinomycetota bacterium]
MTASHDHDQDTAQAGDVSWWSRVRHSVGHLVAHDHDHGPSTALLDTGSIGIRATKVSLIGLGITALLQAIIVVFSGSVALLSDTLHNLTDALTSIPLWIAFALGRRAATRKYTYGFNRTEDIAGLVIVVAIAVSAVLVIWESVHRIAEPRLIDHIPWVIAAGFIGALGNELVARYRIRVGQSIGSEALVTDGRHARTDALTSLAVVAAGIGAALGASWVDPVAGLVVAVPMLWLLAKSARRMLRRLSDGIEPEIVDEVGTTITGVEGVDGVGDLRVRWHGHQLRIAASISVDPNLTVRQGHDIAHDVEHELLHHFTTPVAVTIHVEPHEQADLHDSIAHHRDP